MLISIVNGHYATLIKIMDGKEGEVKVIDPQPASFQLYVAERADNPDKAMLSIGRINLGRLTMKEAKKPSTEQGEGYFAYSTNKTDLQELQLNNGVRLTEQGEEIPVLVEGKPTKDKDGNFVVEMLNGLQEHLDAMAQHWAIDREVSCPNWQIEDGNLIFTKQAIDMKADGHGGKVKVDIPNEFRLYTIPISNLAKGIASLARRESMDDYGKMADKMATYQTRTNTRAKKAKTQLF